MAGEPARATAVASAIRDVFAVWLGLRARHHGPDFAPVLRSMTSATALRIRTHHLSMAVDAVSLPAAIGTIALALILTFGSRAHADPRPTSRYSQHSTFGALVDGARPIHRAAREEATPIRDA